MRYSKRLCAMEDYYFCYKVTHRDSWNNLFPDEGSRDIVMRLNRMNAALYPGIYIAVPKNLENVDYMASAPFSTHLSVTRKTIVISIDQQAFAAYDSAGNLVRWGPVSTAIGWCEDINRTCTTPRGTFFVYAAGNAYCKSSIYPVPNGGAPMPYCMYFNGGYALHAGELPGYNASHGCVRMMLADAEWLNLNFVDIGKNGTKVIVR